ncbi:MAG TPA: formate dehydrogenase accessory sulfurtransferase FdhD [Rhodoblastus sp.]|nr:formate dehydrogenase accessory sulfurtransferase FdhD [Rhodoblastus sp.]
MTESPNDPQRTIPARIVRYDTDVGETKDMAVAVEAPLNIVYGDTPYAVMMVTPADIEDFVFGFSLTEGVIGGSREIRGVEISRRHEGYIAAVNLAPDALRRHMARRRNLSGRTSCGLCGVEDFNQLPSAPGKVGARAVAPDAIARALRALHEKQTLFRATRAVHGAAWCAEDGAVRLVREDVGRHNALDKTIGACLREGFSAREGFALVTSRCSFEMIEKTAIFGAPALVSVSAPTSLAIERAQALGVTLIAVARDDGALAFVTP